MSPKKELPSLGSCIHPRNHLRTTLPPLPPVTLTLWNEIFSAMFWHQASEVNRQMELSVLGRQFHFLCHFVISLSSFGYIVLRQRRLFDGKVGALPGGWWQCSVLDWIGSWYGNDCMKLFKCGFGKLKFLPWKNQLPYIDKHFIVFLWNILFFLFTFRFPFGKQLCTEVLLPLGC